MDQYAIEMNLNMLALDFLDLVALIKESDNDILKEYLPDFEEIIETQIKFKIKCQ